MRSRLVSILAAVWVAGAALPAGATIYWASPNGSDDNPGTLERPWKSLQKAANSMRPGDTVLLADGEYTGGVRQRTSGTAAAPITFKAVSPGKAIVRGDLGTDRDAFVVMESNWIVIDGLTLKSAPRAGIWVATSQNVTVKNCRAINNNVWGIFTSYSDDLVIENNVTAFNTMEHGIYVSNSGDRPRVRYNLSHDNGKCGIQLNGDAKLRDPNGGPRYDGIINGAIIEGNVLYNNNLRLLGAAINLACVHNGTITNNLIYNNKRTGIALFNDNSPSLTDFGSKNNLIAANTIHFKPGEGGWMFVLMHGSTNNTIKNNILSGGARSAYEYDGSSSFRSDYNLIFSSGTTFVATTNLKWLSIKDYQAQTGNDRNSIFAAAKFSDPLASDFRLQAGSPAKKVGVAIPQVPVDLLGRAIPEGSRPDLGCYGAGDGDLQAPPPTEPVMQKTAVSVSNGVIASGRTAKLKATLKSGATPIENRTLTYKIDGAVVGTATTDAQGLAVLLHVANESLGQHTVTVEFAGEEFQYLPSSGTGTLTILARTRILPDRIGAPAGMTVNFNATLTRTDTGSAMEGRVLTFFDGEKVLGTAVTDASGRAQITLKAPAAGVKYKVGARFLGETDLLPSEMFGYIVGM